MRDRSGHVPSTLSGGEAARAGLAVALANDPPLLLADEPTGEVDAGNEQLVLELLQQRAARGRGVLLVTHSTRAARAADRVLSSGTEASPMGEPLVRASGLGRSYAHGATRVEAVRVATFAIDDGGHDRGGRSVGERQEHAAASGRRSRAAHHRFDRLAGDRRSRGAAARPDRDRVPGSELAPATHRGGKRRPPGDPRRRHRRRRDPLRRSSCSRRSMRAISQSGFPTSSRGARRNGSGSPARSPDRHGSCSPTSRPDSSMRSVARR